MTTTTVKVRLPLPMGGDLLVSGKTTNPTEEELKLMQMEVLLRRASLRTASSFGRRKTNNRQSIDKAHEMQKHYQANITKILGTNLQQET
ncbi:hypothetical protein MCEMSE6_02310 [Oxalobacteraceae bacterium]